MRKIDLLFFFILALMIISVSGLLLEYYKKEINSCTKNPLVYGAKEYLNGNEGLIHGSLRITYYDLRIKDESYYFNDEVVRKEK